MQPRKRKYSKMCYCLWCFCLRVVRFSHNVCQSVQLIQKRSTPAIMYYRILFHFCIWTYAHKHLHKISWLHIADQLLWVNSIWIGLLSQQQHPNQIELIKSCQIFVFVFIFLLPLLLLLFGDSCLLHLFRSHSRSLASASPFRRTFSAVFFFVHYFLV